jgi:hypothetical protein
MASDREVEMQPNAQDPAPTRDLIA